MKLRIIERQNDFDQIAAHLHSGAQEAVRLGAERVAEKMRELAPKGETHQLENIRVDNRFGTFGGIGVRGGGFTMSAYSPAYYARFQEYGTAHNRAHPFARPAADMVEREYGRAMIELVAGLGRSR